MIKWLPTGQAGQRHCNVLEVAGGNVHRFELKRLFAPFLAKIFAACCGKLMPQTV
jgi:hypothetical protein